MPLSTEFVVNKPLTGDELRKIIVSDLDDLLAKDGMFNSHIAYGRVGYTVSVELKLANPSYPEHKTQGGPSKIEGAIEGRTLIPLEGEDRIGARITRNREVRSPNVARVANGLPVNVQTRQDGKVVEKALNYTGRVEVDVPPSVDSKVAI